MKHMVHLQTRDLLDIEREMMILMIVQTLIEDDLPVCFDFTSAKSTSTDSYSE